MTSIIEPPQPALAEVRADATTPAVSRQAKVASWYKLIWRWHFYAGLLVTPVMLMLSITGGIYIWIDELEPLLYADKMFVTPSGPALPLQQLVDQVRPQYPTADTISLQLPESADRSVRLRISKKDSFRRDVHLHPYTGAVLGDVDYQWNFFPMVLSLHRRLMAGQTGRYLVEIVTSWGIVLLLTGIFLWWPRKKDKVTGVVVPRFHGSLRAVLRDGHAVLGFYSLPLVFLVVFTGLFFTAGFGFNFRQLMAVTGSIPQSKDKPPQSVVTPGAKTIGVDQVAALGRQFVPHGEFTLSLPIKPTDSFRINVGGHGLPTERQEILVDQYSGAVLNHDQFWDHAPLYQFRTFVYPVHVGSIFGLPTKILAFAVCLALVTLTVTGTWMWWVRRPTNGWGFPPASKGEHWPKLLFGIIICLGLLMPFFGISLLVLGALDWIWSRSAQVRVA